MGNALGCFIRHVASCFIILAPDADIVAAGFATEDIKRHEIAHCNGWPSDHRGALPYIDSYGDPTLAVTHRRLY
jgi:hypothetical protein